MDQKTITTAAAVVAILGAMVSVGVAFGKLSGTTSERLEWLESTVGKTSSGKPIPDRLEWLEVAVGKPVGIDDTPDGSLRSHAQHDLPIDEDRIREIAEGVFEDIPTPPKVDGVPKGTIAIWNGGPIPSGWGPCDGEEGRPKFSGYFLRGADKRYDLGTAGGTDEYVNRRTRGHVLTIAEMPEHSHRQRTPDLWKSNVPRGNPDDAFGWKDASPRQPVAGNEKFTTDDTGGDSAHDHALLDHDNRPAFKSVLFIIKL